MSGEAECYHPRSGADGGRCLLIQASMRAFKRVLLGLVLGFLLAIAGIVWLASRPLATSGSSTAFSIPPGASLRSAAQAIQMAGIGLPPWQLELLGRLLGRAAKIKSGSYEVGSRLTALELLDKLTRGDVTQGELVLVEGRTFRQFRALLDEHPDLRHDTAGLAESEILSRLGAAETRAEGLFFPDTYLFDKGSSDLDVLRRAYKAMRARLASGWESRDPSLPLRSSYDLLILASIVEKETGLAADRPLVAAVFANRLRRGMLLQTDPTVIYGLGDRFDGNLRKVDLQRDTPWNTYTRPGLPPTPIAMPGLASLQAAARPPASDRLYFVARGDGSSQFSATLADHNSAVARYQKGR